jgi:hypothetical protein
MEQSKSETEEEFSRSLSLGDHFGCGQHRGKRRDLESLIKLRRFAVHEQGEASGLLGYRIGSRISISLQLR